MHQELFAQIKEATENIDKYYVRLFEIVDNIIRKIKEAADAELAIVTIFDPSSTPVSNCDSSIKALLLLKAQLEEERSLCYSIVSDINTMRDGANYPRSGQNNAFYVVPESFQATATVCKKASVDVLDGLESINDTLNGLDQSPYTTVEFDMLHKTMSIVSVELQALHSLYDQLAMHYQKTAESYASCEESVSTSFKNIFDDRKVLDVDARRRALAEALRTGEPIVASTSSSHPDVSGHNRDDAILVPNGKLAGGCFCRICGNALSVNANYCSYCGSKTRIDIPKVELTKVNFSAIAPKELLKGMYSLVEIIMYEDAFRNEVERIIADSEVSAKETKGSVLSVEKNAHIKIVLNSPDLVIDDNVEEQYWCGEYARFTFPIELPLNYRKPQILFTASVYINDIIATRLKFVAKCKTFREQKIEIKRDDVLSAFVSYASQDRHRVAMIIQGMKKARPDMDIFFDVESLRSGDDWESALWTEIDKRDILFLCWSHFAKESKWVDAEWRYALSNKGVDCIEPVPIDPPGVCPPPEELNKKHFNDKLLYIINSDCVASEKALSLDMDDDTARRLKLRLDNLF